MAPIPPYPDTTDEHDVSLLVAALSAVPEELSADINWEEDEEIISRTDVNRIQKFEKMQREKLQVLTSRIERLKTQEQKCWKDISRTQVLIRGAEVGQAAREQRVQLHRQLYDEAVHELADRKEKVG